MGLLGSKDSARKMREEDGRYVLSFEGGDVEMLTVYGDMVNLTVDPILGIKDGDVIDLKAFGTTIRLFVTGVTDGTPNRETRRQLGIEKRALVVGKRMNVKVGG